MKSFLLTLLGLFLFSCLSLAQNVGFSTKIFCDNTRNAIEEQKAQKIQQNFANNPRNAFFGPVYNNYHIALDKRKEAEIADSMQFKRIKTSFQECRSRYKVLITPDALHEKSNCLIIKWLIDNFAQKTGLPILSLVFSKDLNPNHNYDKEHYLSLQKQIGADAIIVSSYESYKDDSIITHTYLNFPFPSNYDIIQENDSIKSVKLKTPKIYSIEKNKDAQIYSKVDFYKGQFLSDFIEEIINYFIETNKNDIDNNLRIVNQTINMYPNQKNLYYNKMDIIMKSEVSRNEKLRVITECVDNILRIDTLDFWGNYLKSNMILREIQKVGLERQDLADTVKHCIQRMTKSDDKNQSALNTVTCLYKMLSKNFSGAIQILKYQPIDSTLSPHSDFFLALLYMLKSTHSDSNRLFLDSSSYYIENAIIKIRKRHLSDIENFSENYLYYEYNILSSIISLENKQKEKFQKSISIIYKIDQSIQKETITYQMEIMNIENPFKWINIEFKPRNISDLYLGVYDKLNVEYYIKENNYDSANFHMDKLMTLPYQIFNLKTKEDSTKITNNLGYLYYKMNINDLILDFGEFSYNCQKTDRALELLLIYYRNNYIDTNHIDLHSKANFHKYFYTLIKLYKLLYQKDDIPKCIHILKNIILYYADNSNIIIDSDIKLWESEFQESNKKLKKSADYPLIKKNFKKVMQKRKLK